MNETSTRQTSNSYRDTILISLFFTAFIAVTYGFGIYLFSVVVSDMKADIGFDYMVVGIITGSVQIAFFISALLSGIISPKIGGGRVILGSVVICGICLTLLGFAPNIWVIGFLLVLLGGCAASVWVPMVEVVSRFIPFEHRSKVLGLMSSGTSYGVFINGLIVPYFINHYQWSYIWVAVGSATILITVMALFCLSSSGVFGFVPPPMTKDIENPKSFEFNKNFLSTTNLTIWLLLFLSGLSCIPFQTYLAPYIRDELLFPVEVAGQVWTIIGFVGMGGGFAIGALSDKTGIRFALSLSYFLLAVAAVMVSLHSAPYQLMVAGVAFGLSFYAIYGLVPAYIAKTSTPAQTTIIFGIANVTQGLGCMAGNFVGGWSKTFSGTFLWIYVGIVIIALISIAVSWILPNEQKQATTFVQV